MLFLIAMYVPPFRNYAIEQFLKEILIEAVRSKRNLPFLLLSSNLIDKIFYTIKTANQICLVPFNVCNFTLVNESYKKCSCHQCILRMFQVLGSPQPYKREKNLSIKNCRKDRMFFLQNLWLHFVLAIELFLN